MCGWHSQEKRSGFPPHCLRTTADACEVLTPILAIVGKKGRAIILNRTPSGATQRLNISSAASVRPGSSGVENVSFSSSNCTGFAASRAKS